MDGIVDYMILVFVSFLGGLIGGLISYKVMRKPTWRVAPPTYELAFKREDDRKKRYIVFEVATTESISAEELSKAIENTARRLLGDIGLSQMKLKLVDYDSLARRGVIRVRRSYKWQALAVLSMVRSIGGKRIFLAPLFSSGSLKRAREKAGLTKKS